MATTKLLISTTLSIAISGVGMEAAQAAERPNVIFFLIDDLGYSDISFEGRSSFYQTPNIDKFISESLFFENSYSAAANSAPARACLMTGVYTPRHGVYTVGTGDRGDAKSRKFIAAKNRVDVASEFYTMGEMFSDAGYRCASIGKWHLGSDLNGGNTGPLSQGFHHNIAGDRAGTPYSYFYPYTDKKGLSHIGLEEGDQGEYLTDRLTDEAIKFITDNRDEPFFLYLSHHGVHTPIVSPGEELQRKYESRKADSLHNNPTYAAMIESVDISFSRIIETIEKLAIEDDTIAVLYSDNGGSHPTNCYPLRGGKGTPYEGGSRVPLAIKWSGKTTAGSRTDVPVTGVDFYPTFAKAIGAESPEGLDGEDIFTLIETESYDRDIFWHFPAYLQGYSGNKGFRATPYSTIRSGDWKLIYLYEDDSCELYNLATDASESENLSQTRPDIREELLQRLNEWLKATNAPTTFDANPEYSPAMSIE
ncbi:MAG: sulfatase [Rikenellaceae bacterium]